MMLRKVNFEAPQLRKTFHWTSLEHHRDVYTPSKKRKILTASERPPPLENSSFPFGTKRSWVWREWGFESLVCLCPALWSLLSAVTLFFMKLNYSATALCVFFCSLRQRTWTHSHRRCPPVRNQPIPSPPKQQWNITLKNMATNVLIHNNVNRSQKARWSRRNLCLHQMPVHQPWTETWELLGFLLQSPWEDRSVDSY